MVTAPSLGVDRSRVRALPFLAMGRGLGTED